MNASGFTVLHCLSGGIDSTSVLLQLLDAGEIPLVCHIRLDDRADAEANATNSILDYCERRYAFRPVTKWSTARNLQGVFDIEVAGLVAGGLLRQYETIQRTTTSSSLDDRSLSNWQHRHANRIAITESLANRKLKWLIPNALKSRKEIIEAIPNEVLRVCSVCRNPKPDKPYCGNCYACNATLRHLKKD